MCCICSFVRMILPAPGCRCRVFNRCLCKIFGQARGAVSRRCHWCLLRGHCWASIPVTKDVLEQPLLLREGMALLDVVGTSLTGVRIVLSSASSVWPLLRIGAAQRMQTQAPPLCSLLANSRMTDKLQDVDCCWSAACHAAVHSVIVLAKPDDDRCLLVLIQ